MNADTPRPPKDLPTTVVQQVRDLGKLLDQLIEKRGRTVPPPSLLPKSS